MNENPASSLDFNRRDFLRSGSVATLMTMLGGVELIAQTTNEPAADAKPTGPALKVGVIGLGSWGREILNTLALIPQAEVAAVCDTYPASVKRAASLAPKATPTEDYKTILANPEIKAVVIATPTHQHKDVVIAALAAGKSVYCEAPLAHTVEDAKAIALAAKAAKQQVFQAGLQLRSDPQRPFLLQFIRSGAIGQFAVARAQSHKKQSWRATSPKPEREKELNWRLRKASSLGLLGEIGVHQIDEIAWFMNAKPVAVTGWGANILWKDDREVPDTIQAVFEFPGGANLIYDATLANSFESDYEVICGSDAAVMLRESKAWMFKEVDSPLLGWEVYAKKETFLKETGIVLKAGASKSGQEGSQPVQEVPFTNTPLSFALKNFVRNTADLSGAAEDYKASVGDDPEGLAEHLAKVTRRAAAGYLEGFQAAVMAIKGNEATLAPGQRLVIKPEWFELG